MAKCDSAWVFSCKFVAHFLNVLKNTSGWLLLALYNLAKVIILHSLTSYRINVSTSFSFSKGHHEYRDIYLLKTMITALLDS